MSEQKPREFYLVNDWETCMYVFGVTIDTLKEEPKNPIRVIEKSAYDELKAENERWKQTMGKCPACGEEWSTLASNIPRPLIEERDRLAKQVEILKSVCDQAMRQWHMYITEAAQDDIEEINHAEAQEWKRCSSAIAECAKLEEK